MLPREWLYVISNSETEYILYAPIHKTAFRLTSNAANNIASVLNGELPLTGFQTEISNFLTNKGLLVLPKSNINKKSHKIFLSITNKCNLRCIYCYASAGIDNSTMDFNTAKCAIDHQVQQTINSGDNKIAVTFHGGGEAFVELKLLMKIVSYINEVAEKNKLKPVLGCVTNATLITKDIAKWIAQNFSHLTISLDGTQEIQDTQRPHFGKKSSFLMAMTGIKNLIDEKVNFSIRATVTEASVNKMAEFVYFSKENIFQDGGNVDFEPVSLCGRAKNSNDIITTNADVFFENYINARKIGKEIGINVTCSMDTFGNTKENYCGASQADLQCYTPDNMLSACTRVTKKSDDGAHFFFYGDTKNNQVKVNINTKENIKSVGKRYEDGCNSCFARWNCQGGCLITRLYDRENYKQSCYVTQKILLNDIRNTLDVYSNQQPVDLETQHG